MSTISQMVVTDGLTQAHNKRYLFEQIDHYIHRAVRDLRPFTLLLLDVDRLGKINETYGELAGDEVLRVVAGLMLQRAQKDELVGRLAGGQFVFNLPGSTEEEASALAEEIRQAVAAVSVAFDGVPIPVTVSCGVCSWNSTIRTAEEFLRGARDALHIAHRGGRNRTSRASEIKTVPGTAGEMTQAIRRVLDGPYLLQRVRGGSGHEHVVAWEIDEPGVVARLGTDTHKQWLAELIEDVERSTESYDPFGTWRDRLALVALKPRSPEELKATIERIRQNWTARPSPLPEVPRTLRHVVLRLEELPHNETEALDELTRRLVPSASQVPSCIAALPFPLVALLAHIPGIGNANDRVSALFYALDTMLRFIVMLEVAILRADGDDDRIRRAAQYLQGLRRPLSLGRWEEIAWRLATLLPERTDDVAVQVCRKLVRGVQERSSLAQGVLSAVRLRNDVVHATPTLAADSRSEDEAKVRKQIDALLDALQPLSQYRMVSVDEISFAEEDSIAYKLRIYRGPQEAFPLVDEQRKERLIKEWCYLLHNDGGRALLLAPMALARSCERCHRVEVFIADRVILGPKGTSTSLRGVLTGHQTEATIPWSERASTLFLALPAEV